MRLSTVRACAVAAGCVTVAPLAAPVSVLAQTPFTEHTLEADAHAPPPPLTLSSVAWLAGHWRGNGLGASAEEVWLPLAGGAMAGAFRLVSRDTVRFYELLSLVEVDGSLVLRLKHFHPDLVGWEAEEDRVEFPLLRADSATLWFDGLTMRRVGADELKVWVALEHADRNVEEALFVYRRVGPGSG